MSKIVTITLNTAFDNIIQLDFLTEGTVIRAENNCHYVSGKGVNSARALSHCDVNILNFAFVGAESKKLFESFNSEHIKIEFLYVPGHTRFNTTIVTRQNKLTTHIQTKGYFLEAKHISLLKEALRHNLSSGDIVILSGSLPQGIKNDTYKELIELCKSFGCRILFDSSGEALNLGLAGIPFFIKPNKEEFEGLTNIKVTEHNLPQVLSKMREFNQLGIEMVFLSLGKEGVIVSSREGSKAYRATLYIDPSTTIGEDIGCGDSLVAGVAYALFKNDNLLETIRFGLGFGAANLYLPGPGNVDMAKIRSLMPAVQITELN